MRTTRSRACIAVVMLLASTLPLRDVRGQRVSRVVHPAARMAVYDSRVLFDSMPGRNAVESAFALEQAKARTMVTAASDSLRLALDDLVRADERLTPREREAGKLHLRARELLVEQMVENLDVVIQQRLDELRRPLLERMHQAVRVVRTRLGYDLVLDRAMGDGLVIDADAAFDITHAILAELRSRPEAVAPAGRADGTARGPAAGARP